MNKPTKLHLLKDKLNADYERERIKAFQSKVKAVKPKENELNR